MSERGKRPEPGRPKKPDVTRFGTAVSSLLTDRQMSNSELAQVVGKSDSYVGQTLRGVKSVSPAWADLVADVLGASKTQRATLHRAAALDSGFKLDLTLPTDKKRSGG